MGQKFNFSEIWSTSIIWCDLDAQLSLQTCAPGICHTLLLYVWHKWKIVFYSYNLSLRERSSRLIPIEFKWSAVRKCIPYPTKILIIFTDVTGSLSTVSKYFIIFHRYYVFFLLWKHPMTMWSLGSRNPKANLICMSYLFGCLKCTLIFALDFVTVKLY